MTDKTVLMTEEPPSYPGVTVDQPGVQCRLVTESGVRPQNYLGLAFFALLCCCCWPAFIFAIVGLIFSVQVDSQYTNKDFLGAKRSSDLARNWSIAAIATGVVIILVYFSFRLVCFLLEGRGEDEGDEHSE